MRESVLVSIIIVKDFFYLEITLEDWKVIQYFQEWPSVHQEFHLRIVLSCQIFFKAWVT